VLFGLLSGIRSARSPLIVGAHRAEDREDPLQLRVIAPCRRASNLRSTKQGRSLKGFRVLKADEAQPAQLALNEQVRVEAKSGRIDERILAKNPELFSELSRIRGEAEFRAGLLPALALLFVAVALHVPWTWWLLGGLGLGLAFFEYLTLTEVFQLRSRARGIALRAVLDGLVSTPTSMRSSGRANCCGNAE